MRKTATVNTEQGTTLASVVYNLFGCRPAVPANAVILSETSNRSAPARACGAVGDVQWDQLLHTLGNSSVTLVDARSGGSYPRRMPSQDQTLSLTHSSPAAQREPVPGLVLVWTPAGPTYMPRAVGEQIVIGRGSATTFDLGDGRISRGVHCTITKRDGLWHIKDEGSKNGTYVDGIAIHGTVTCSTLKSLRVGDCVFLPVENILDYEGGNVDIEGDMIVGPNLRSVWQEIQHKARGSGTLHIIGESGSGKEHAARLFHPGPPKPFIAENCATIPEGIAESVLFGRCDGAYAGAKRGIGLIQAANGGTLFLDEIGELPLNVQAKLLRVLQEREVRALGATQSVKVSFRMVSATHKDLGHEVGAERFRMDLYHRLAHPTVRIPSLRERAEELPWMVHRKLLELSMSPHSTLVEACLLRFWPGNVRELFGELKSAMGLASAAGREVVKAEDLRPAAGQPPAPRDDADQPVPGNIVPAQRWLTARQHEPRIREVLTATHGNVSRAAEMLGVHRTQLSRWLDTLGIDPKTYR